MMCMCTALSGKCCYGQCFQQRCTCVPQDVRNAALEFLFNLAVSNGPLTQQTLRWLVTSLTPSPADVGYLGSHAAQQPSAAQHAQTQTPATAGARGKQDISSGHSGSEPSADVSLALPGMHALMPRYGHVRQHTVLR